MSLVPEGVYFRRMFFACFIVADEAVIAKATFANVAGEVAQGGLAFTNALELDVPLLGWMEGLFLRGC